MPVELEAEPEEIEEIPGEFFDEDNSYDYEGENRKILLCDVKQSLWHDRFCGWYDASLTKKGMEETQEYAQRIKKSGILFNYAFTSALKRTKETLDIILKELGQTDIETESHWLLNSRHLGALTGLNIEETIAHYSYEQVDNWTNYYTISPPTMKKNHKYYLSIKNNFPELDELPMTESYIMTQYRILKYWNDQIVPKLSVKDTGIIIVCHNSTLLTITRFLEKLNPSSIVNINIKPPFYYDVDKNGRPFNKIPL